MSYESSAPGKVILFGEHSVVHGYHAVASALDDLRVYARFESENQEMLKIDLRDLGILYQVDASELLLMNSDTEVSERKSLGPPRPEILARAKTAAVASVASLNNTALVAVIYLCAELLKEAGSLEVVSAGLPIGAGLGSSAAFGVAVAGVLLAARGIRDKEVINAWAFAAEVIVHGSPSGLDNAMSCFGGHALFARDTATGQIHKEALPGSSDTSNSLNLLITNTRKPRRTRNLVDRVSSLLTAIEEPVRAIFTAIDAIAIDFAKNSQHYYRDPTALARLLTLNHDLLRALQVSDPVLEVVVDSAQKFNAAATKLTGAGGGGCAITLLHDTTANYQAMAPHKVTALVNHLQSRFGYLCYQTKLGGTGLILSQEGTSLPGSPFTPGTTKTKFDLAVSRKTTILTSMLLVCIGLMSSRRFFSYAKL